MLVKTLKSPVDCKEIKPVNPKGNLPWIVIGRTDVKLKLHYFGHLMTQWKSWLIGKDPDAWKDWGQKEKGATEDEMVGRHHRLNGHECEQTLGILKDREAWWTTVYTVSESWTQLSDWPQHSNRNCSLILRIRLIIWLKSESDMYTKWCMQLLSHVQREAPCPPLPLLLLLGLSLVTGRHHGPRRLGDEGTAKEMCPSSQSQVMEQNSSASQMCMRVK